MNRPSGRFARVWDVPTRLFHWAIVALVGVSWWSAKSGRMDWHLTSGLTVFGLLVFRLVWGLIGTDTARFAQFVRGPRGIWDYARGRAGPTIGHNPLGGWSVVALIAALTVQVGAGLVAVDVDGIESGPLSRLVSFDTGRTAASIHAVSFNVLLALIALHVAAILFYFVVRRRNLIGAMVTGRARAQDGAVPVDMVAGGRGRLTAAIAIAAAAAWWVSGGARL